MNGGVCTGRPVEKCDVESQYNIGLIMPEEIDMRGKNLVKFIFPEPRSPLIGPFIGPSWPDYIVSDVSPRNSRTSSANMKKRNTVDCQMADKLPGPVIDNLAEFLKRSLTAFVQPVFRTNHPCGSELRFPHTHRFLFNFKHADDGRVALNPVKSMSCLFKAFSCPMAVRIA
jgi:hypothetical protein